MSNYTVDFTDNSKDSVVVEDRTVNTDTSIKIPGRYVTSYGSIIAENFIHMLENFARCDPPENPITGQLWYFTDDCNSVTETCQETASVPRLKIFDGTNWIPAEGIYRSDIMPNQGIDGDIWLDTVSERVYIFNGIEWVLIAGSCTDKYTGVRAASVQDTAGQEHTVIIVEINGELVAIISDQEFDVSSFKKSDCVSQNTYENYPSLEGFQSLKEGFNLKGIEDLRGYTGSQGVAGPPGPSGAGSVGYTGSRGPTGPTGPSGSSGPPGPTGPTGYTGSQGVAGPPGPGGAGSVGYTGSRGPTGPTGYTGSQGVAGPPGPGGAGSVGYTGSRGPTGPTGPSGSSGPTGPTGPRGYTGSRGPSGPTGPTGPSGSSGPSGPTGPRGYTGSRGPSGPTGPTGPSGSSGPTGPTGPRGYTGSSGAIILSGSWVPTLSSTGTVQPSISYDSRIAYYRKAGDNIVFIHVNLSFTITTNTSSSVYISNVPSSLKPFSGSNIIAYGTGNPGIQVPDSHEYWYINDNGIYFSRSLSSYINVKHIWKFSLFYIL